MAEIFCSRHYALASSETSRSCSIQKRCHPERVRPADEGGICFLALSPRRVGGVGGFSLWVATSWRFVFVAVRSSGLALLALNLEGSPEKGRRDTRKTAGAKPRRMNTCTKMARGWGHHDGLLSWTNRGLSQANCRGFILLHDAARQLPWNDTLAEKHRGEGVAQLKL
jgi:hypothetical protein